MRLFTRCVDVSNALLSVPEMVDCGHAVVFDQGRSFALHKTSGRMHEFCRNGKGWDLTLELETPEEANKHNHGESVRRLAEIQQKEEDKKPTGLDVLKELIDRAEKKKIGNVLEKFDKEPGVDVFDNEVYPFGRQQQTA